MTLALPEVSAGLQQRLTEGLARVEALIAGHGMEEALKRGEAYRKAGADAVLIHSRERHPDEILQFKKEWGDRLDLPVQRPTP